MANNDMNEVTGRARASAHDVADHLSQAAGSAVKGARELKEDTGKYARAALYQAADQAAETGREVYSRAGHALEQQSSQLDVYVRNNPMKSLGFAFGIGLMFGMLKRH